MEVYLVDGPVRMLRQRFGVMLECPPEIAQVTVHVGDRLDLGFVGPSQKDGPTTEEWFNIVGDVSKPVPDKAGHPAFTTKPGKRCLQRNRDSLLDQSLCSPFIGPNAEKAQGIQLL